VIRESLTRLPHQQWIGNLGSDERKELFTCIAHQQGGAIMNPYFSPGSIGKFSLAIRIVVAPIYRYSAKNGKACR